MSSEIPSVNPNPERQGPKVVRVGEDFYPFQPPIKRYYRERYDRYSLGYSLTVSTYSEVLLKDIFIPNLLFFIQAKGNVRGGKLWIESERDHLAQLGLLKPSPLSDYRAPQQEGYFIFNADTLKEMQKLRVNIILPDGEFESSPHIWCDRRTKNLPYAEGIDFTRFKDIKKSQQKTHQLHIRLKDDYLKEIKARFTVLETA